MKYCEDVYACSNTYCIVFLQIDIHLNLNLKELIILCLVFCPINKHYPLIPDNTFMGSFKERLERVKVGIFRRKHLRKIFEDFQD